VSNQRIGRCCIDRLSRQPVPDKFTAEETPPYGADATGGAVYFCLMFPPPFDLNVAVFLQPPVLLGQCNVVGLCCSRRHPQLWQISSRRFIFAFQIQLSGFANQDTRAALLL
jgi:hypothetical protein